MPLGGIRSHGEVKHKLQLGRRFKSIQASINSVSTKYRAERQVTGLIFQAEADRYPELLGQLTGLGTIFTFEEDEWLVDFGITTTRPLDWRLCRVRPTLSQVKELTIITNLRSFTWPSQISQSLQNIPAVGLDNRRLSEITWEFNAIYDRVIWN